MMTPSHFTEPANTLAVYPTYLSLVQARDRALEHDGVWDGRGSLLFQQLLDSLSIAARARFAVSGRPASDLDLELLRIETIGETLEDLRELPAFGELPERSLRDVLAVLVDQLLLVRRDTDRVLAWMDAAPGHRLPALARLFRLYLHRAHQAGILLPQDIGDAVLRLLEDRATPLPPCLFPSHRGDDGTAGSPPLLVFRAVRWLNPLQLRIVRALAERLGRDRVVVESTLPADYGAAALLGRLEGLLREPDGQPLCGWVQDIADAVETRDAQLVFAADQNLDFNRGVGVYGEVEDLARRICWEMTKQAVPPHRIALVVRNLGEYSDAVTDVFGRFGIPFFFRRGRPAASVPLVKILLSLADLRAHRRRDTFCALLESPWPKWPALELRQPHQIADDIRRAGIPPVPENPQRMASRLKRYYHDANTADDDTRLLVNGILDVWNRLTGPDLSERLPLEQHVQGLREVLEFLRIPQSIDALDPSVAEPDPADPLSPARVDPETVALNRGAWRFCTELLAGLKGSRSFSRRTMTSREFALLLAEFIADRTVPVPTAAPDGVWVINPYDAACLAFDVVILAGLNAGRFPARPDDQSLFTESDRNAVHDAIPGLPPVALPTAGTRNRMESILFLTALAAARKRAVLSCQACDTAGNDLLPSVFFNLLWELAGWASPDRSRQDLTISAYNQWRMQQLGAKFLADHLRTQQNCATPYRRMPFPGESFLATVPLPLCRAADEARQRLTSPACTRAEREWYRQHRRRQPSETLLTTATAVADGIQLEAHRAAFFARQMATETPVAAPAASGSTPGLEGQFNGVFPEREWQRAARIGKPPDLSPSALETLARCPFRFWIEGLLRADVVTPADIEPDPRDTGKAVHVTMHRFMSILRGDTDAIDWARSHRVPLDRYQSLIQPACAVRNGLEWHLVDALPTTPGRDTARVLPVVLWQRQGDTLAQYQALGRDVVNAVIAEFRDEWNFGDHRLELLRTRQVRDWISNYIHNELTAPRSAKNSPPWQAPDRIVAPALFEFVFSDTADNAGAPSLALHHPARDDGGPFLKVHGKIDRVDLLFDAADRRLCGVHIIDYKSLSRASTTRNKLMTRVASNEECQLPIYGLAALAHLFPEVLPESNTEWHGRTFVQFYGYGTSREKVRKTAARNYLVLGPGTNEGTGTTMPLLDAFLERLRANVDRLCRGDLAPEPLTCDYCPHAGVCRIEIRRIPNRDTSTRD